MTNKDRVAELKAAIDKWKHKDKVTWCVLHPDSIAFLKSQNADTGCEHLVPLGKVGEFKDWLHAEGLAA
jgi:hypothetical protein